MMEQGESERRPPRLQAVAVRTATLGTKFMVKLGNHTRVHKPNLHWCVRQLVKGWPGRQQRQRRQWPLRCAPCGGLAQPAAPLALPSLHHTLA